MCGGGCGLEITGNLFLLIYFAVSVAVLAAFLEKVCLVN